MYRLVVKFRLAGPVAAGLAISLVATAASAQTFGLAPGGPSGFASQFIYTNFGGLPTAVASGVKSSLLSGDAIDGFSDDKSLTEFLLAFSVDAGSSGAALAPTAFGPNVTDQAARAQAAGDAFISTEGPSRGLASARGRAWASSTMYW